MPVDVRDICSKKNGTDKETDVVFKQQDLQYMTQM